MTKLSLFVLVVAASYGDAGQHMQDFQFEHVSLEQGVANTLVWCIYQDRKGFLWYGTMYGLVKYDGYEYTTCRHDPADTSTLANDDIISICEDRNNFLWIGTFGGGVNRLDRTNGKFKRYLHKESENSLSDNTVWVILEDRNGSIWFGTDRGGLDKLDPATNRFSHFRVNEGPSQGVRDKAVLALCQDPEGTLWVGTRGDGLFRFDSSTGKFVSFTYDSTDPAGTGNNTVSSILRDRSGALWVGTRGGGLYSTGSRGEVIVRYRHHPADSLSLPSDFVNRIVEDHFGQLWVATAGGLALFHRENGTFSSFRSSSGNSNTLSSNSVTALLEDRSGIFWIGTYHGGLDRLLIGRKKFSAIGIAPSPSGTPEDHEVTSILEDRRGRLWVGTRNGLAMLAATGSGRAHWTATPQDPEALTGKAVNALCVDSSGAVWVGTTGGLNRFDERSGRFTHYLNNPVDSTSLSGSIVNALLTDREGVLWVGTNAGVSRFDGRTGCFRRFLHNDEDSTTLSNNFVLSLFQDNDGHILVGTYGGLSWLDKRSGRFMHDRHDPYDPHTLSNNYVLSMSQDKSGRLWIGTGGGLNLFDPVHRSFTSFTERDGLPNGVICAILEDHNGVLWLSTNRGLSCFDADRKSFKNFDRLDGLQSNMFLPGSAYKRYSGEMLFGGMNGLVAFTPESLSDNQYVPPVVVTTFMLFDDSRRITQEFSYKDDVTLSYRENFFALSFAALDFTRPEKNTFAYMLEGFDNTWIRSGRNHFARYTNLEPGEYIFRVKGTNNDGVWNDTGSSLRITITPPYWKTVWFKVLSASALLCGIVLLDRLRVRARVRQSLAMEQVRRAEAERVRKRAANDFHDELGHRLTKIGLFTEIVKRKLNDVSPEIMQYLDKIIDDSQNLTNDTRDFIWTLDPDKDSLYDVAIHLKEFGEELFDRTGVQFTTNGISEDLLSMKLPMETRRHLTLIFKEGMNNIIKHSGCRNVMLSVEVSGGTLRLSLSDDGKGYTNMKGSGYGLKSMQQRADKIQSSIRFDSEPGKGSRIELTTKAV